MGNSYYERMEKFEELSSASLKRKRMIETHLGAIACIAGIVSSIASSVVLIVINPIPALISIFSGILFMLYFYRKVFINNPVFQRCLKKIKKLLIKILPSSIGKHLIVKNYTMTLNYNDKEEIVLFGKKEVLEVVKRMFYLSPMGYIKKDSDYLKEKGLVKESKFDRKKGFYEEQAAKQKHMNIRKLKAFIYSEDDTTKSLVIAGRNKEAIGFFIDSIRSNGIKIKSNKDKGRSYGQRYL